ncbi:MAG TPA: hypothetical protein VJM08_06825, partial [Anaerolineales bacterium]|nr:hypothetical protein [Anaerolineales bacterium]
RICISQLVIFLTKISIISNMYGIETIRFLNARAEGRIKSETRDVCEKKARSEQRDMSWYRAGEGESFPGPAKCREGEIG